MLQDPVNQFPSDLGGYFSGCRLVVVVVVAVVIGDAFPGECPLPPGFSWDLRMKPPFWRPLRILFRTPSTILWEYWERETSGKRDEHGTARERVNDWENAGRSIFERPPGAPPSIPPNPGRRLRLTLAPLGLPSQWRRKEARLSSGVERARRSSQDTREHKEDERPRKLSAASSSRGIYATFSARGV